MFARPHFVATCRGLNIKILSQSFHENSAFQLIYRSYFPSNDEKKHIDAQSYKLLLRSVWPKYFSNLFVTPNLFKLSSPNADFSFRFGK